MQKLLLIIASLTLLGGVASCGNKQRNANVDVVEFTERTPVRSAAQPSQQPERALSDTSVTVEGPAEKLNTRRLGNLAEIFNDSNYIHWAEGEKVGITPLSDMRSHWHTTRPLLKLESCADYSVDELTYSVPYLVPEGVSMVREIGSRFRDTLRSRGGGDYRIIVTSVLRTPESVRRLRRVNRNAIDSSVHQMGTTVDISYAKFFADSDRHPRTDYDLKMILAEILYEMRREGKIWVKYEQKQPCFHITCRKTQK